MLSPARKLAPRREAVVLRLLALLAFFAGATAVGAAAEDDRDQTRKFATRNAISLERLHAEAAPVDALSEPEQPEQDFALDALPIRLASRVAPVVRLDGTGQRVVRADRWLPQPISSVVMAQGPP
ncbi:MAG TPA: hypothetical protein VFX59_30020 [Polyangiales bacterium]|nr:hypothetical protein [Polyangiales bacterium]